MKMNRKNIFSAMTAMAVVLFCACSEWTEPEAGI